VETHTDMDRDIEVPQPTQECAALDELFGQWRESKAEVLDEMHELLHLLRGGGPGDRHARGVGAVVGSGTVGTGGDIVSLTECAHDSPGHMQVDHEHARQARPGETAEVATHRSDPPCELDLEDDVASRPVRAEKAFSQNRSASHLAERVDCAESELQRRLSLQRSKIEAADESRNSKDSKYRNDVDKNSSIHTTLSTDSPACCEDELIRTLARRRRIVDAEGTHFHGAMAIATTAGRTTAATGAEAAAIAAPTGLGRTAITTATNVIAPRGTTTTATTTKPPTMSAVPSQSVNRGSEELARKLSQRFSLCEAAEALLQREPT